MAARKKPLKGLGSWLGSGEHEFGGSLLEQPAQTDSRTSLPVEQLHRGRYQPRQRIDGEHLKELADSIRAVGIIEPVVVRPDGDDSFEILAGELRWRAAQLVGLAEVPVVIREVDDRTAAAIALIENLQRQDLNPIEEALGISRLKDEFGLSQTQIAENIGRSQPSISRSLGLLGLDEPVQTLIQEGRLEAGHGKVLLGLDPATQRQLAQQAASQGWSVRDLERHKAGLQTPRRARSAGGQRNPDVVRLEQHMQARLGNAVQLKYNEASGRGRLEISFNSLDECNGLLEQLGLLPE